MRLACNLWQSKFLFSSFHRKRINALGFSFDLLGIHIRFSNFNSWIGYTSLLPPRAFNEAKKDPIPTRRGLNPPWGYWRIIGSVELPWLLGPYIDRHTVRGHSISGFFYDKEGRLNYWFIWTNWPYTITWRSPIRVRIGRKRVTLFCTAESNYRICPAASKYVGRWFRSIPKNQFPFPSSSA